MTKSVKVWDTETDKEGYIYDPVIDPGDNSVDLRGLPVADRITVFGYDRDLVFVDQYRWVEPVPVGGFVLGATPEPTVQFEIDLKPSYTIEINLPVLDLDDLAVKLALLDGLPEMKDYAKVVPVEH